MGLAGYPAYMSDIRIERRKVKAKERIVAIWRGYFVRTHINEIILECLRIKTEVDYKKILQLSKDKVIKVYILIIL